MNALHLYVIAGFIALEEKSLLSGTSTAENTEISYLVLNDSVFKGFDFYFWKSETAK